MEQQPLEAAEILHHALTVRVLREGLVQFGLQTLSKGSKKEKSENICFNLEHSHGRMFLQSLPQVEANLDESLLRLECFLSDSWGPAADSLRVEVLRLFVVYELVQDVLVILIEQVLEVAPGLGRNVGAPEVVIVYPVHGEQHLLVLAPEHRDNGDSFLSPSPLFSPPALFKPQIVSSQSPPHLQRTDSWPGWPD